MTKDEHDALVRKFSDEGRLIEIGWAALWFTSIPGDAPPVQIEEMRKAYFCGAQHLWASVMGILEPDKEPTANDLRRMDLINDELASFVESLKAKGRV